MHLGRYAPDALTIVGRYAEFLTMPSDQCMLVTR